MLLDPSLFRYPPEGLSRPVFARPCWHKPRVVEQVLGAWVRDLAEPPGAYKGGSWLNSVHRSDIPTGGPSDFLGNAWKFRLFHSGRTDEMNRMMVLLEDNSDDEILTLRAFKGITMVNQIVLALAGVETLDFLLGTGTHEGRDTRAMPAMILVPQDRRARGAQIGVGKPPDQVAAGGLGVVGRGREAAETLLIGAQQTASCQGGSR